MAALAKSDVDRLTQVYRRYMAADLGDLNATAIELREAARNLGWRSTEGGFLPWVRLQIGVSPDP